MLLGNFKSTQRTVPCVIDPVVQRFLNADGVVAGAGGSISGYNLFSYCFNNPVNLEDDTGNWPKFIKTLTNKIKNLTKNKNTKLKKGLDKIFSAFTLEVGLGLGLKGGIESNEVDANVGFKSDSITLILNSKESKIGQRIEMECTASWGPIEFGPCQSDWNPVTESDKPESSFTWLDTEPVLDFGTEFYFFAGFTINLSVDLETIDEGLVKIFE